MAPSLLVQIQHLLAALLLLLAFAMLATRRLAHLVSLFTAQGLVLAAGTLLMAGTVGSGELLASALLTLGLKVLLLPYVLRRLLLQLRASWDREPLLNIPSTQLIGIVLVIFAFVLTQPITQLATPGGRGTLGIALAVVFLALLMMIVRSRAIAQVIAFLALENGLLFAATSATAGMPMVIELGIGLDVLVGMFILGIFMFQIRERFDSLDLDSLQAEEEA